MSDFDFKKEVPQAFPVLDAGQIKVVAEFADCKTYADGDVLIRAGETDFKFHVIKSGAIEIVDRSSGEPRTLLVHEAGEFTGDLLNLTGRSSNVDAIARGETDVYEVCEADLHRIVSERPALSDLILQTFITRAQTLNESETFTGLRVIGARFSPDTFRIRDFLSKNHVLYTYFDFAQHAEINTKAPAVLSGDEPRRSFRRRRRAQRFGQARRVCCRRRLDGGAVRSRIFERNLIKREEI